MRSRLLSLGLAAAITIAGPVARNCAQELTRAAFDGLKNGGFVVVVRHGGTDAVPGLPEDKSPLDLANCADQAMLSEAGRDQARAIGTAFKSAGIPVGKVLASGYCRAIETAPPRVWSCGNIGCAAAAEFCSGRRGTRPTALAANGSRP